MVFVWTVRSLREWVALLTRCTGHWNGHSHLHVWAGNFKKDPKKRTDVGEKHGKTRWIGFDREVEGWQGEAPSEAVGRSAIG